MEVIDNAINDDELNIIQEIMLGKTFPWFFNNNTSYTTFNIST